MGSFDAPNVLVQLLHIINTEGQKVVDRFNNGGVIYPSLDDTITDHIKDILNERQVLEATSLIIAAAGQLIATMQPTPVTMSLASMEWSLVSCLRVANECNVVEALREAGPKGMHVDDLAHIVDLDNWKLARLMRYLSTRHYFKEVSPNVFANNRLSAVLDTGKSLQDIVSDPQSKHDNTNGMPAWNSFIENETSNSSIVMLNHFKDSATKHSRDPKHCNLSLNDGVDIPVWEWMVLPKNEFSLRKFRMAMRGSDLLQPPELAFRGFDWASLPNGSRVVDVGGGIGTIANNLVQNFNHLTVTVQDRPEMVSQGETWFSEHNPVALKSERIRFQVQDFFKPQPPGDPPAVYFMRMITHDWSDDWCRTILTNLRSAASLTPPTYLVIVDCVLQSTAPNAELEEGMSGIKGATLPCPPEPLLPNLGVANSLSYAFDICMLNNCNASERTMEEFIILLDSAGWKIKQVLRPDPLSLWWCNIVAIPKQ